MTLTPLPGAPPLPEGLAARLAEALSAKGPSYVPRTHHLEAGRPKYTNRLVLESSPYLLQHAHNPVSWHAWGDEAFEEARRLGRPVFLSIGYSTCHWCHVMEGESFEDVEIATFLNEHYVCIKVDREERPDVDGVYMTAVQALTGSGGWPMSVWLTPDREPFFGGTYFPPRDGARGMGQGFLTLLGQVAATYAQDPQRIKKATASLTQAIKQHMEAAPAAATTKVPGGEVINETVELYKRTFDPVHGGIRRAPKFPSNLPVRLLLRHHRRTGDLQSLHMATLTLERMAAGGMYDQIGGGFHRYSTDERWLVPHFEKMLYDNALLAVAYTEAYQATGRGDFARVVRETLDYVSREMTSPEGAFYSATDADSEGEEGKFFVWSLDEVKALLGPEAERFARYYDITPRGNFEGHNIPNVKAPNEAEHAALAGARAKLYEARRHRVPPLRDDKILSAWNGLMISAFASAGFVLDKPRYIQAATRAADFVLTKMRDGKRIARSFKDGRMQAHGFLEDQAFVAAGLLDLFEATFERRWLVEAVAITEAMEADFGDTAHGGWFTSPRDGEKLIAREKPTYDGAEPSGTSVALLTVLRLATLTSEDRWRVLGERGLSSLSDILTNRAMAMTEALLAVDFLSEGAKEVALVWAEGAREASGPLLDVLRRTFAPNKVVVAGTPQTLEALQPQLPFLEGRVPQAGKPTAYVCERGHCELPVTAPDPFAAQLGKTRPL